MKNIKEIKPILTALYCINFLGNKDEDIDKILKYAFNSLFNSNTNLLTLVCVGRTKEDVMPEIWQVLKEETKFKGDE
ncbi:MAG: hypothetical protein ACI4PF_01000 [Christensenellales bacterium]